MDDQNTPAPAPEQPQQDCPLLKLLTELRIKIYAFAHQHTIHNLATSNPHLHPFTSQPSNHKTTPFHSGAFALPHVNRTLRAESLDTLEKLVLARLDQLVAQSTCRHNSAAMRLNAASAEGFNAFALALAESFEEAMVLNRSTRRLEWVCRVMGWRGSG